MSRRSTTLSSVARECEVSESTVSRVLNGSKQGRFSVSPEVRGRILRVAQEMNYRPSVAARNLTVGKTHLVAVLGVAGIWSDRVGPAEEALSAVAEALDKAGYELCVSFLNSRRGAFDPPPLRVDGMIALGAHAAEHFNALDHSGVPYVSINGSAGTKGASVNPDDARGVRLALKHLVDLGHRRIAYLDHWSQDATHPSVTERREAFKAASADLGFATPQMNLPLLPANSAWDPYYEPFVRRAILEERATAVLAYSHQGALGLMRAAHDLGLAVPRDFSLACFNNEPVLRLSVPSITAVDLPTRRMGAMAAEILLRAMSSEDPFDPVQVRLEESLVVRESTAPPPQRE